MRFIPNEVYRGGKHEIGASKTDCQFFPGAIFWRFSFIRSMSTGFSRSGDEHSPALRHAAGGGGFLEASTETAATDQGSWETIGRVLKFQSQKNLHESFRSNSRRRPTEEEYQRGRVGQVLHCAVQPYLHAGHSFYRHGWNGRRQNQI